MHRSAITRVELIIILVLAGFAAGLLVLLLARQRENGLRLQCMNNLRRLGEAVHAFHDKSSAPGDEGKPGAGPFLPPARIADGYATWAVLLAPHLASEHPLLHWDVSRPYFSQDVSVRQALLAPYFCPARERPSALSSQGDTEPKTHVHAAGALGDYAAVSGTGDAARPWDGPEADGAIVLGEVLQRQANRIVLWRGRTSLGAIQAARGLSATLLIGDKHVPLAELGRATAGDGSLYNGQHAASSARVAGPGHGLASSVTDPFNTNFGSGHRDLCQFVLADGSVRSFDISISEMVLGQLARRGK
jgi:hypothetical protein